MKAFLERFFFFALAGLPLLLLLRTSRTFYGAIVLSRRRAAPSLAFVKSAALCKQLGAPVSRRRRRWMTVICALEILPPFLRRLSVAVFRDSAGD